MRKNNTLCCFRKLNYLKGKFIIHPGDSTTLFNQVLGGDETLNTILECNQRTLVKDLRNGSFMN